MHIQKKQVCLNEQHRSRQRKTTLSSVLAVSSCGCFGAPAMLSTWWWTGSRAHRNTHGCRLGLSFIVSFRMKLPRKYCSESYKTENVTVAICTINVLNFVKDLDSTLTRKMLNENVFKNEKRFVNDRHLNEGVL